MSREIPHVLRGLWQSTLELIAALAIYIYEETCQEIAELPPYAFFSVQPYNANEKIPGANISGVGVLSTGGSSTGTG